MAARIDLASSIPLSIPFVLMVEPTNVCNLRCTFCPESLPDYQEQAGYYQAMSYATWRSIYESFRGWGKVKTARFFHTGEPLLNRRLPTMLVEALDLAERTEITTNGILLTAALSARLLSIPLSYIRISVYATEDLPKGNPVTGLSYPFTTVLENVRTLRTMRETLGTPKPFIMAELVGGGDPELFRQQWGPVADKIAVKKMHNWGDAMVQLGTPSVKQVCPFPFYELDVKANGDVTVCCVDWDNKLKVGNVNDTSLRSIWEGSALRELRDKHLSVEGRFQIPSCRNCNAIDNSPDNLDRLKETVSL